MYVYIYKYNNFSECCIFFTKYMVCGIKKVVMN